LGFEGSVFTGVGVVFLTLMEEHRLSVFENRELRRISGSKRNE
jgi:hypothetical protein